MWVLLWFLMFGISRLFLAILLTLINFIYFIYSVSLSFTEQIFIKFLWNAKQCAWQDRLLTLKKRIHPMCNWSLSLSLISGCMLLLLEEKVFNFFVVLLFFNIYPFLLLSDILCTNTSIFLKFSMDVDYNKYPGLKVTMCSFVEIVCVKNWEFTYHLPAEQWMNLHGDVLSWVTPGGCPGSHQMKKV